MYEIKGLTKSFGKNIVLNKLTIDFTANTTVIVGLNGAGKTVLLNSITGITRFDKGSVYLDGFALGTKEFKERIFYAPSDFYLPEYLTGEEYAYFILNRYPQHSFSLFLELAELLDLTNYLKKPLEAYSFGMKKKLQIATLIAVQTPYIIADEIFSGLDLETSIIVQELFTKVTQKRKLILVSHEKDIIAKFCNNILIMRKGKLEKYTGPVSQIENFIKKEDKLHDKLANLKKLL